MSNYDLATLKRALESGRRSHALEVRFVSGMCPAIVVGNLPQFIDGGDLKLETVRNIHQECLLLAKRGELISKARATYRFVSEQFGSYLCKYELRGNAASLTLVSESGEAQPVAVMIPLKGPTPAAEASPDGPHNEGTRDA
jgi:hypothetical protein